MLIKIMTSKYEVNNKRKICAQTLTTSVGEIDKNTSYSNLQALITAES